MIKGLSNIIKENKKMRAIDKMLGCTCDRDRKPISEHVQYVSETGGYLPTIHNSHYITKNCPIHGYRRFRK